jgi:hypothetical protein
MQAVENGCADGIPEPCAHRFVFRGLAHKLARPLWRKLAALAICETESGRFPVRVFRVVRGEAEPRNTPTTRNGNQGKRQTPGRT